MFDLIKKTCLRKKKVCQHGVPSAESARSLRGLGKGVSGSMIQEKKYMCQQY